MDRTIDQLVAGAAVSHPDNVAVICGAVRHTFAALEDRVGRLAAGLAERTARGATVAVLSENSAYYVECLYAIPRAGRVALLLNYRHHPNEWLAMLETTAADMVIGEPALLDALAPLIEAMARPPALLATDLGIDELIGAAVRPVGPSRDSGAAAWLIPTSGTTGTPKLATLTHRSLLVAAAGCAAARPIAPDEIYLLPFPLCHIAAYNVLVYHRSARPVVLLRRFEVAEALRVIASERVTIASFAPTMLAALLDDPALGDSDLSSLRTVAYGSSGIPEPLLRRAMSALECGFSQGYGMTELSGNCVFLDEAMHRRGLSTTPALLQSAGLPTAHVELRIVDDGGGEVGPGVTGEICVRGEQVMAGYWGGTTATEAVFDGWLHTGDLGYRDADGYLFVVDRKKDVIVSGGENVASREVEAVLLDHPAVREVAVVGIADAYWGEIVGAVVVLRPGASASAGELVEHCRERLAGYKKPRRVVFVDELPKNTTGKIEKQRLRDQLGSGE